MAATDNDIPCASAGSVTHRNTAGWNTYQFTVSGTPVPYKRMTQGQVKLMKIPDHKISAKGAKVKHFIRRYLSWKEFVYVTSKHLKFNRAPQHKVYLDVVAYFADKTHGDPGNIRKGIEDALYKTDKYVAGNVEFFYDKQNPRCEVTITEPPQAMPPK